MGTIRLVVFDLDGTLTRGDTVCCVLAHRLGRYQRMLELEQTISDEPGIIRMREELVGYYRGWSDAELTACLDALVWAPGAEEAARLLSKHGVSIGIATITWTFAAEWVARRLGVEHYIGTDLGADGTLTHVFPVDKGRRVSSLMTRFGLAPDAVAVVGDSWLDRYMFDVVAHRYFVGAKPPPDLDIQHYPDGDLAEIARAILSV